MPRGATPRPFQAGCVASPPPFLYGLPPGACRVCHAPPDSRPVSPRSRVNRAKGAEHRSRPLFVISPEGENSGHLFACRVRSPKADLVCALLGSSDERRR
ncbi:hypothetical protein MRX96_004879 [Rhipicephalus microplus]